MKPYVCENVTLLDDGDKGIYLIVKDETGIIQEWALLPEELPRIKEVIERYLEKKV
jgi:hypothetical protein